MAFDLNTLIVPLGVLAIGGLVNWGITKGAMASFKEALSDFKVKFERMDMAAMTAARDDGTVATKLAALEEQAKLGQMTREELLKMGARQEEQHAFMRSRMEDFERSMHGVQRQLGELTKITSTNAPGGYMELPGGKVPPTRRRSAGAGQ